MRFLKSIGAVVAGFATAALVVTAFTALFVLAMFGGDFNAPPTGAYLVANLVYTFGAAILGGLVAGRLAPSRPLAHAAALGLLLLVPPLLGAAGVTPDGSASTAPEWYSPVVGVLGGVGAVVGAWRSGHRAPAVS